MLSYLASGIYLGSCTYDDLCDLLKNRHPDNFNPTVCLQIPTLADNKIDCNCPFDLGSGFFNLQNILLEIPDASLSLATFWGSGDFNVTASFSDSLGEISNIQIQFSCKTAE